MSSSNSKEAGGPSDCAVRCLSYTHHQRYFSSDHKPVSGVFDVYVPYSKLLGGSSTRSRLWPRRSVKFGLQGSRRVAGPSPLIVPLSEGRLTRESLDASSVDGTASRDFCLPCLPGTNPIEGPASSPTLADVDLMGGGAPPLLPDPLYYGELEQPSEHAQEANLLSLPTSPRNAAGSDVLAEGKAELLQGPSASAADPEGRSGGKPQASGSRSVERAPSAIDELDALLSRIHVQSQKEGLLSDWASLDFSQPCTTLRPPEQVEDAQENKPECKPGQPKSTDLSDLLL